MSDGGGRVVLVGATGYTGRLVAAALAESGLPFLLTGRNAEKLERLAGEVDAPRAVLDVRDDAALRDTFRPGDVVINCAGPFMELGEPVVAAAVERGAHYLDTTGEQPFMKRVRDRYHEAARSAGVAVTCAMAFEYALGDAAAARAGARLEAPLERVDVVYAMAGAGASRGTRRTMARMAGQRGWALVDGELVREPMAARRRTVELPGGETVHAFAFTSGEVLTVPRHTPARTVRGWIVAAKGTVNLLRLLSPALPVLAPLARPLVDVALRFAPEGPRHERRHHDTFTVVVHAAGPDDGFSRTAVQGHDPYGLTAAVIVLGARACLDGPAATGVLAPSELVPPDELLGNLVGRSWISLLGGD